MGPKLWVGFEYHGLGKCLGRSLEDTCKLQDLSGKLRALRTKNELFIKSPHVGRDFYKRNKVFIRLISLIYNLDNI